MRTSTASLAIFQYRDRWLVQWNESWRAYSLIGGHLDSGESFLECCTRKIIEELECQANQIKLTTKPLTALRFQEFSDSVRQETDYEWSIFEARLDKVLLENLPTNCDWVAPSEIEAGHTTDHRSIARQVKRVLHAIGDIRSVVQ